MESQQLKENTINSLLEQVDKYFIKKGDALANILRFDVGKKPDLYDFRIASAFETILRTELCDLEDEIDDEFLEHIKFKLNELQ